MTGWQLRIVHLASTAAFAATLVLGGCSDGLEVNGKLFDWMGISSSALMPGTCSALSRLMPVIFAADHFERRIIP